MKNAYSDVPQGRRVYQGTTSLENAIWFIWKDDLLPLDMKKEQLLQDALPLNTAICFECQ